MKKKNLLLPILALALVGCGPSNSTQGTTSNSSGNATSGDTSNGTSSQGAGSSSVVVETYKIVVPTDSRYTLTPDKTKAKEGETVTVVAVAKTGYEIGAVLVNGTAINKTGDNYVFTMPDHDVRLSANLDVKGDVVLSGEIAALLTKDSATNIYVARDVEVNNDANFSYFITKDGIKTQLTVQNVDRTKCFADVEYSRGTEHSLKIAGGAKYDFFYDPANSDRPCYMKRTEVTALPKTASAFESLFAGEVQSACSVYPENVNTVTYSNTLSKEKYEWEKLKNNKSYATVKDLTSNEKTAEVYKEIKDGVYTIVDTYTEGNHANDDANDKTRRDDTKKFSGRYKVSDTDEDTNTACDDQEFNTGRQFVNGNVANFDLNLYSHDMTSLDFDMMYAYRVQKTVGDEIVQASVKVESVDNKDDTFTTTVTSSSTYDSTAVAANTDTEKYHDEYLVHLTFNKAGAVLNGDYKNTHYTEKNFNFTTFTKTGDGTIAKQLAFAYTYGDAADDLNSFDKTPYFISSLTPTVTNALTEQENTVNVGENPSDYLKLNALPTTALDNWQYKIQASANTEVVKWDSVYRRWNAESTGTSELTVSNSSTKDVTGKVTCTVAFSRPVRNFNLILDYGYEGFGDDGEKSGQALIYEKHIRRYKLTAMGDDGKGACGIPADATIKLSDETTGLKVSLGKSLKTPSATDVIFDATDMTAKTDGMSITMTVNTSHYSSTATPSTFTVFLLKTAYTRADMVGTWNNEGANASVVLTDTQVDTSEKYYSERTSYYGYVTVKGTKYEFGYDYREQTYNHEFYIKVKGGANDTSYTAEMSFAEAVDGQPEAIQFAMVGYTVNDSWEATYTDVLGTYVETGSVDDPNYFSECVEFTRGA